ncbi:hypothetical protein FQA39_LY16521 [Lamprigera yunnana]|nr:hypothetical protein FQA39_LY16521 [Lamprigera yunnana]
MYTHQICPLKGIAPEDHAKNKLTREDILKKKRETEKPRLARIKSDPIKLAEYKEKQKLQYLRKKEKGQRKNVKEMTPREQQITRKKWKNYSSNYRAPDGVGATCKRTADQVIATGGDITNLNEFATVIGERYLDSEDDIPLSTYVKDNDDHFELDRDKSVPGVSGYSQHQSRYSSGDYVLVKYVTKKTE